MRYLLLFAFCTFMSFPGFAQKYVPFPTAADSPIWRGISYGRGRPTSIEYWVNASITIGKDTVYQGKTYHILNDIYVFYNRDNNGPLKAGPGKNYWNHAIREENKRIYKIDFDFETEEYLLYDFNVKVGDTIKRKFRGYDEVLYILKTDSILLSDGIYHRTYTESYGGIEYGNIIIEGVGGTSYSFTGELECFSLAGKPIYKKNYNYSRCGIANDYNPDIVKYQGVVGLLQEFSTKSDFKIFPNPTTGQFTIQTQSIFSESNICVRDVLGRIVLQEKLISPNQTINISNQPKGLYFVELYCNGKSNVQKVILQ